MLFYQKKILHSTCLRYVFQGILIDNHRNHQPFLLCDEHIMVAHNLLFVRNLQLSKLRTEHNQGLSHCPRIYQVRKLQYKHKSGNRFLFHIPPRGE